MQCLSVPLMISTQPGNAPDCVSSTVWAKTVGVNTLKTKIATVSLFTTQSSTSSLHKSVLTETRRQAAVIVDGIPGELYSLELAPGSFIEATNGAKKEIKSGSKAGFVVSKLPRYSITG